MANECTSNLIIEPPASTMLLGDPFISIPTACYESLIRAKIERDAIIRALANVESYNLKGTIEIIVGTENPKAGEGDA